MNVQTTKITFYAKRTFGEKMTATFDFIKENWKPMLKYITYLMLPIALLMGLTMNKMLNWLHMVDLASTEVTNMDEFLPSSFFLGVIPTTILSLIAAIFLAGLIFSFVQLYNTREDRLNNITFAEIKPLLFKNSGRAALGMLFLFAVIFLVAIIIGLLAGLVPFLAFILVPLLFVIVIPFSLFLPVYLFEEISAVAALKKSFRLGFATWGGTFLILLVMGIIANILQGVFSLPWGIMFAVKSILVASDVNAVSDTSVVYTFLLYIVGVLAVFGNFLSMVFTQLGMCYQYAHASEVIDSITIESDIDKFEQL